MNTDWRLVDQELRGIARSRAALDAKEAKWLRGAERLGIWRHLGHPSMLAYMERTLGHGPQAARERLRIARALESLPIVEDALQVGALSYSATREITRVATAETEKEWVAAVRDKTLREIEELVAGRAHGDLPDDPARPELRSRMVRFELMPDAFAQLRETRKVLDEEHGRHLDDEELIVALCRRALEPSSDGTRALHQIAITLCDSCGRGWQDGAGVPVEIAPAAIERALCDAVHIGPVEASKPARATRDIPQSIDRLVRHRDHGRCRVPGCRSARNLDVHHIVRRADGGSHEPENLMLCCSGHHGAIHEGRLSVTGTAPDRLVFEHEDTNRPSPVDLVRGALVHMGFRVTEARAFVEKAYSHVGDAPVEALLREALRCSSP